MKNATRKVLDSLPVLEKYLKDVTVDPFDIEELNKIERSFLKLILFFESPDQCGFDIQILYKNVDEGWLLLGLNSIHLFFEKDTYFMKSIPYSFITEPSDYLNQKDFVDYLNENGQQYTEAKMSVYIQRDIIPSPDLVLSDTKYWVRSTCEKFVNKLNERKQ